MKHQFKIILVLAYFFSACQNTSTFDELDVNTIDLTRITGESSPSQSFFDSALWSAALGAVLLAALSSTGSSYNSKDMEAGDLDAEWIE